MRIARTTKDSIIHSEIPSGDKCEVIILLEEKALGLPIEGSEHPMNFLLGEEMQLEWPESGDIREGHVVAHRQNEVLVDIGAKSEGIIPSQELEKLDPETLEKLAVGNPLTVYVVTPEDRNGNIILSYTKAIEEEDWLIAQQLMDSQDVFNGKVVGYNRGGLLVMLGRIRGFVPASQLATVRWSGGKDNNDDRLQKYVGDELMTKVVEVDRSRNRLILSERAANKEIREAQRLQLLDELHEGEVREGKVVNLADFGAFVDIGGIEGLVHLSELSWKRVNSPSDVLEIGQELDVYVLNVDQDRNRVALSLKRLEPDPWTLVEETYQEGELVEATITKLARYGAFARLNDDYALEGLIHISELSEEHIEKPQDIVSPGQVVAVRIIRVDSEKRQLGLSIKQVTSSEYLETDLAIASDSELE